MEINSAYCEHGPLDGCQPFEERKWLRRNLSPSVAAFTPVLGKDERPILSIAEAGMLAASETVPSCHSF